MGKEEKYIEADEPEVAPPAGGTGSEEQYDPREDWINQRDLADLLGIAAETASRWASKGKLEIFEHGMIGSGKRKYSRCLVEEYQEIKFRQARQRLRDRLARAEAEQ